MSECRLAKGDRNGTRNSI